MSECSICGLPMLIEGREYSDGELVHCADGHVAMVSCDRENGPDVGDAELASEWVLRLVLAFPDAERKRDVRTLAAAVEALEKRYDEEGSDG